MKEYFIRRLLLLVPTLLGITIVVFTITRFVPGGPLDQARAEAQRVALEGGTRSEGGQGALSPNQMKQLKRYYGFDKPVPIAYLMWLGIIPREVDHRSVAFADDQTEAPIELLPAGSDASAVPLKARAVREDEGKLRLVDETGQPAKGWKIRWESTEDGVSDTEAVVYRTRFSGVLQWDLGTSYRHSKPVWSIILERFPISIYFGLITILITYFTCIPLGVLKAIKHQTPVDTGTSVLIFIGYAIPGYVLATILQYLFSFKFGVFPHSGFESEAFATLSFFGKIADRFQHTLLPLCCYLIGSFAVMTMLMKNQLMDNLSADYVRTAIAKGVPFRRAVMRHAFRNSLVPIATGFGQIVTLLLTGSFLIEKIFDINGFGLLGLSSIIERDYPVVMGIVLIGAFLMLLGNIISDLCVAFVDPRIRFGK